MSLQSLYFAIGVAGLVLGAVFLVAAIAYFIKVDIRGVLDDLSGRRRHADVSAAAGDIFDAGDKDARLPGVGFGGAVVKGALRQASGDGHVNDSATTENEDLVTSTEKKGPKPRKTNAACAFEVTGSLVCCGGPEYIDSNGVAKPHGLCWFEQVTQ